MTLIDVLDTHVVMGDRRGFEDAVRVVIDTVSFDQDAKGLRLPSFPFPFFRSTMATDP
jgi:hypothetical protein